MKLRLVHAVLLLCITPVTAQQITELEDADPATAPVAELQTELDQISVTATRSERAVKDIAGTVSVLEEFEIERQLANDISDLVRYEPGVTVDNSGRFGLTGFRIRGIGGDRVLTTIDGIRIADEFSFGPFQDSNRDFIDLDALKAVEIIRGPASALYGSDAIGGVVSFLTKDPEDYLGIFNKEVYISAKAGYNGASDSALGTLTLAGKQQDLSGLFLYTRRDGHETESYGGLGGTGPTREQADPQDYTTDNVLAKLIYEPSETHRLAFTLDHFQGDTDSELLSSIGTSSRGVSIEDESAHDERERTRYSVDYRLRTDTPVFDQLQFKLYRQDSQTDQHTSQLQRLTDGSLTRRSRDSSFEQNVQGTSIQLDKDILAGTVSHHLVYGGEAYTIDGDNYRYGSTVDVLTGEPVDDSAGAPTRAFPLSETTHYAAYVQDEITLADGRLTLTPGLRFDYFELDASSDPVYESGNPGIASPEDFDDTEFSPKFGAVFRLNDTWSIFGQYAQGFRAPPYDDINVGFINLVGGYTTVPNPNLKPETSEGFELGLRSTGRFGSLTLTGYYNEYEDFIESLAPQGFDPVSGLLIFQSINRAEVTIQGVEIKGELFLDQFSESLQDWRFNAAIAYARGEDETLDQPLNSIDPLQGVLGLSYDHASGNWGGELIWTLTAAKDRVDESTTEQFKTPGYGIVDVLGYYRVSEHAEVNFGVFNLTDKEYWQWSEELIGRSPDDPALARLTEPGRNFNINFRTEW